MQNNQSVPDQGFRPISEFFLEQVGGGTGLLLLYLTILLFSLITYKLGFARKLPLLKALVVYILLALGCLMITFFAIVLPMAEVLIICAIVLGVYRFRLHRERQNRRGQNEGVEGN
ncbi:hypothetical protein HNQ94_003471 [Salirhabdus euzebyi]|uniref:YlaH-like protein n=1 Tax=Salirhabdus euzebyi TaxID=394506 RepID=A0A841Q9R3_9BACI|nr:YlaH-like family protein [Salirhabdus euzebyi]MBB6454977.1 hypothetical protein [Salirhabdus euzebyi]